MVQTIKRLSCTNPIGWPEKVPKTCLFFSPHNGSITEYSIYFATMSMNWTWKAVIRSVWSLIQKKEEKRELKLIQSCFTQHKWEKEKNVNAKPCISFTQRREKKKVFIVRIKSIQAIREYENFDFETPSKTAATNINNNTVTKHKKWQKIKSKMTYQCKSNWIRNSNEHIWIFWSIVTQ